MKKYIVLTLLLLACLLALSACGCKHENWNAADCENPKTCAECGQTEGAPLGHSWLAATCETPKTCEVCGKTDGQALGHNWAEATCEAPKTCGGCGKTEGQALGHIWAEATTEAPKTCTTCGKTEGERIVTDERFTTAATLDLQGKWRCPATITGTMMGMEGLDAAMECEMTMVLGNDGTMTLSFAMLNAEAFSAAMNVYMVDLMYQEFTAQGLNRTEADATMKQAYGMTVQEYIDAYMDTVDFGELLAEQTQEYVYYVAEDRLYAGDSWKSEMDPVKFTLAGDTLILEEDLVGNGAETTVLTRITE